MKHMSLELSNLEKFVGPLYPKKCETQSNLKNSNEFVIKYNKIMSQNCSPWLVVVSGCAVSMPHQIPSLYQQGSHSFRFSNSETFAPV